MMAGCVKFRHFSAQPPAHMPDIHTRALVLSRRCLILALQTIVTAMSQLFHPLVLSITELHLAHVELPCRTRPASMKPVRYFHKSDGELVEKRFKQQV